jgi:hypothetical protein
VEWLAGASVPLALALRSSIRPTVVDITLETAGHYIAPLRIKVRVCSSL